MNESRLTSLALMHIHYDKIVDLDRVVDLFSQHIQEESINMMSAYHVTSHSSSLRYPDYESHGHIAQLGWLSIF